MGKDPKTRPVSLEYLRVIDAEGFDPEVVRIREQDAGVDGNRGFAEAKKHAIHADFAESPVGLPAKQALGGFRRHAEILPTQANAYQVPRAKMPSSKTSAFASRTQTPGARDDTSDQELR